MVYSLIKNDEISQFLYYNYKYNIIGAPKMQNNYGAINHLSDRPERHEF